MSLSDILRRRPHWPDHPRFQLTVDGEVVGYFDSDAAALEALPDFTTAYYVHELVGSERRHRWFVRSFGYKTGAGMSTAALAASGVPIAPQCINEESA